jgi:ubiquinone/menaquinone biosynthesis C-methylase UbiE
MNVFDEMGNYWAEMADKSQTQKQIQFVKTLLPPDGWVLDLACGTARHSIPLTKEGYSMVGLDVSAKLLRIAKQRWRQVALVRADMRFLPFRAEAFAAAVSMDTSLGYLPSAEDDVAALAEVHRVLAQGGVLIADVFNREHLQQKYQGKDVTAKQSEYPSFFLQQKRAVSDNGSCLYDEWQIRDKTSRKTNTFDHKVRLYTLGRLRGMLGKTGFWVGDVYGGYERQPFGAESSRLILVAKAR